MGLPSNHQSRKAISEKGKVELSEYKGLMPDASTLRDLQEYVPDIAERWVRIAESEVASRQKNDRTIVTTYRNSTYLGMASAFVISILILGVGLFLCIEKQYAFGVTLIGGSMAANVIAWVSKKNQS